MDLHSIGMEEVKDRIKKIIENEQLTQVQFSEQTSIKTSTLSHVLTGRNNPSTEVLSKVSEAFPRYRKRWLLTGEGDMLDPNYEERDFLRKEDRALISDLFSSQEQNSPTLEKQYSSMKSGPNADELRQQGETSPNTHPIKQRTISKIIVYYDDNTFETFLMEK